MLVDFFKLIFFDSYIVVIIILQDNLIKIKNYAIFLNIKHHTFILFLLFHTNSLLAVMSVTDVNIKRKACYHQKKKVTYDF